MMHLILVKNKNKPKLPRRVRTGQGLFKLLRFVIKLYRKQSNKEELQSISELVLVNWISEETKIQSRITNINGPNSKR